MDVCGPFIPSKRGFKYFLVFKDDFSKFRKVYFIKTKDEVFEKIEGIFSRKKHVR